MEEFLNLLKQHFDSKLESNPQLSLRSLCMKYGFSSGQYSDWLSRRRNIKASSALALVEKLELTADERAQFIRSVKQNKAAKSKKITSADYYAVAADPTYLAVLVLLSQNPSGLKIEQIQDETNTDKNQLLKILTVLESLKLISHSGQIYLCPAINYDLIPEGSSEQIRESHKKSLSRIVNTLDHVPREKRYLSSVTIYIDPAKVTTLQKKIHSFLYRNAVLLEGGNSKNKKELYEMNIQLYPWKT